MVRKYTELLVKGIVEKPESVRVTEQNGAHTTLLKISVDKQDMGYVIGKHGRVINSVRVLTQAFAGKLNKRVIVELLD